MRKRWIVLTLVLCGLILSAWKLFPFRNSLLRPAAQTIHKTNRSTSPKPVVQIPDVKKEIQEKCWKGSPESYLRAINRAVFMRKEPDRLNALRALGINISDKAYRKLLSGPPSFNIFAGKFETHIDILERWVADDPHAVLEWMTHWPIPQKDYVANKLFEMWADRDFAEALRVAENCQGPEIQERVLSQLYENQDALEKCQRNFPGEQISNSEIQRGVTLWAQTDLQGALKWMSNLSENDRQIALKGIISQVSKTDCEKALQLLQRSPKKVKKELFETMMRSLMDSHYDSINSDQAGRLARTIFDQSEPNEWRPVEAMFMWGFKDPHAALQYIQMSPQDPICESMKPFVYFCLAWNSPQDMKLALPQLLESKSDLKNMIELLADKHSEALLESLPMLPQDSQKELLPKIITSLSRSNPNRAVQLTWSIKDPLERKQLYEAIAGNWVSCDLEGAVSWVQTLPLGEERDVVLKSITPSLASEDLSKAILLLEGCSTRDVRDSLLPNVVEDAARNDPAKTAQIVEQTYSTHSFEMIEAVARTWAERDQKAALTWIDHLYWQGRLQFPYQSKGVVYRFYEQFVKALSSPRPEK